MKHYWKGLYLDEGRASLLVSGASYFDGSALAENLRVKAGKALEPLAHFRRLDEGARALCHPRPDRAEFLGAVRGLIRINRLREASLRTRWFRGGELLMQAIPLKPLPRDWVRQGVRLATSAVRHYGAASLQGRVKASSMLPNWLAKAEIAAIAEDGLRLTPDGYVAEGVWSNIVARKGKRIMTPPLSSGILDGTTRARLLGLYRRKGFQVREEPITRYDLYTADEIWLCSSTRGALKVREVDGRRIGK